MTDHKWEVGDVFFQPQWPHVIYRVHRRHGTQIYYLRSQYGSNPPRGIIREAHARDAASWVKVEHTPVSMERPKAFWFHYNKPASRAAGKPVLTVHYEGKCHMVSEIDCKVAIKTRISKRQPFCSLAGKGYITFENGKATIR